MDFPSIFRKMLFHIGGGPNYAFISLINFWSKQSKKNSTDGIGKFKNFLMEENPNFVIQLKVKTNIDIVDNFVQYLKLDDIVLEYKPPIDYSNLLTLNFKNFQQLIDFTAKFDYEYTYKYLENPKKKIYTSLFNINENIFKEINTSFGYGPNTHITTSVSLKFILRESIEKLVNNSRKRNNLSISKKEYIKRKKGYIDNLVDYISTNYDVPKHFINSFDDKMEGGVDIFTILLAFVTNKHSDWNWEFDDIYIETDKKVNFMEYLFDGMTYRFLRIKQKIQDRRFENPYADVLAKTDNVTKMKIAEYEKIQEKIETLAEKQSSYFYHKLSMIIPAFFGVLHMYHEDYKKNPKIKNIDDFYDISKNLGENLAYTIIRTQFIRRHYNRKFKNQSLHDKKLNLLNKYQFLNIKKFKNLVRDNFANHDYINILNEIEYNNEKSTKKSIIADENDFTTDKIEMWIFYFMTDLLQVNHKYDNSILKRHSNPLYTFDYASMDDQLKMFKYKKTNEDSVFPNVKKSQFYEILDSFELEEEKKGKDYSIFEKRKKKKKEEKKEEEEEDDDTILRKRTKRKTRQKVIKKEEEEEEENPLIISDSDDDDNEPSKMDEVDTRFLF